MEPPATPNRYPHGEVGHAFGVRVALSFSSALPPVVESRRIHPVTREPWDAAIRLMSEARDFIARIRPDVGWPDAADEAQLCRYCYTLGLFDQLYRVGAVPDLPLLSIGANAEPRELLELAPAECIDDLVALAEAAHAPLAALPRAPTIAGPTFTGSGDVDGADADLILGRTLVDVKATVDPNINQRTIQQVVAYALLDYDDRYGIEELAIYMARQARLIRLPLADALDRLARTPASVAELRAALRDWLTTLTRPSS